MIPGRPLYLRNIEIKGASTVHVLAWGPAGSRPGAPPGSIQAEESRDRVMWTSVGAALSLDGSERQASFKTHPLSAWLRLKAMSPDDPGGVTWSMDVKVEPGDG